MKKIKILQLLFLLITLLVISVLCIQLFNTAVLGRFYCGVVDVPLVQAKIIQSGYTIGQDLFNQNCKSCHKIHEESVGPALFGITQRRPKKWIYAFIQNSIGLINNGDTIAVNVFNKYNKNQMTSFPTFTDSEMDSILIYIESISEHTY